MFAKEGAKVAIGDILYDIGRKVEAGINETGGECLFVHLDVASEADWQRAVSATVARFGKLNVLFNNAGGGGASASYPHDTRLEDWDRVMNTNAKGTFLGTRAAIPEMRRAGGGSIINISSIAGLVGTDYSNPQYHSAKGAIRLLTKSTAVQYAKARIRANSVHLGLIVTRASDAKRADPEANRRFLSLVPMGRWAEPIEVAYGVLFLAGDESSYVTGGELIIDGGYTAW